MTAAVVCSPRISAGVHPEPGATSHLPAWWGATDWLYEVSTAVHADADRCRAHHVAADTVVAVARGMAAYADHRTGRDCRPTNARLVQVLRLSLSTVQRARRLLRELGYVVELVRGRSIMTRAERLQAWRRGSSHRKIAAVFALCSRPRRAPKTSAPKVREGAEYTSAPGHLVDGDTPPGAWVVSSLSHLRSTRLRRQTDNDEEAAPRLAPTSKSGRARTADDRPGKLAADVLRRVSWLRGVSARRVTPTLSRFARAGWTGRDVDLAVADALGTRGWRLPRQLRTPAAYLAQLLREVDPADRPTAAEDHRRQLDRAEDAYRLQLATGAPCEHGTPAGDVPSPTRRLLACPLCRAAAAATAPGDWPA